MKYFGTYTKMLFTDDELRWLFEQNQDLPGW